MVGYGIVLAERLRKQERKMLLAFVTFLSLSLWLLRQNMTKGGGGNPLLAESLERGRESLSVYFSFSFSSLLQNFNIALNAFQILSSGLAKTMCF